MVARGRAAASVVVAWASGARGYFDGSFNDIADMLQELDKFWGREIEPATTFAFKFIGEKISG